MDQSVNSPYYQGYEVPLGERRPYRSPVNESFRSERDPDGRDRGLRKSEVRRSASFHGGARDRTGGVSEVSRAAHEEFNRLYSGKIPLYSPHNKRDINFMMDRVKDEVRPKEDPKSETRIKSTQILTTLGAGGVQLCVGFFYAATHITLVSLLVQSPILVDNVNPNLQRIVFLVFSAVASASSAMLVPTVRYRKLISSGAILLIFSCLSASLVTSGRFMFLPYGVIAGSAHGILRTVSVVAATDVSPYYRVTSVSCATLGYAVGGIMGTLVYYHFMTDYLTSGVWTNNFRILELAAVVALLAGSTIRHPTVTSRRVGMVLTDPGFHCLSIVYALTFLAIGILHYLMPVLPAARNFQFHKFETFFNPLFALYCGQWLGTFALALTGSVCGKGAARACLFVGGVIVFLLGVAVMPHDVAYESFGAFMGLSLGVGLATAFAQILVSVGVARRVGGVAVGVSVSLLMFWQDVGTLLGIVCVDQLNSDFTIEVALYMCGGVLLFAGLAFIVCCYSVVPLRHSKQPFASDTDASSADMPVGITNPGMGRWNGYEYDYRYMY